MTEPQPGQLPTDGDDGRDARLFSNHENAAAARPGFRAHDTKDAPPVMIIDQLLADRYFPGQDPQSASAFGCRPTKTASANIDTIVGVVPHLKVYGFEEPASPVAAILSADVATAANRAWSCSCARRSPAEIARETVAQIVASLDPAQPAFEFSTMQERVEETWATPRLISFLLLGFAGLALTPCCGRTLRRHGLQRAPPDPRDRCAPCARRAASANRAYDARPWRCVCSGAAFSLAFAAAFALSRLIRSLLFGVSANDPLIYLAVSVASRGRGLPRLLDSGATRVSSRPHDYLARRMNQACLTPNE